MLRILLFDSYDSFTYNLKDYLEQGGADVVVVRNDEKTLEELAEMDFQGIVLSPGPQTPEKSGILMEVIAHYRTRLPILGVCLGHQAIGLHHGISLEKLEAPMHGKVSMIHVNDHPLFTGMPPTFEVCRYHSLVLPEFEHEELEITALSDDHQVMALSHKKLPIWGVQFHPEAILTQFGIKMIQNWLNMVKLNTD
ncbi:MAG: aminodeoxychorismate/anthranilate synthase component II [Bacteroidia bacterium]|nr:aminodeoxychorismate/anthranilate synthase component II [Bacteroidia bacterium]